MRVFRILAWLTLILVFGGNLVLAEGFSVRGAYRAALDGYITLQVEGGYSDLVVPELEVGGRLAVDLNVLGTQGSETSILLYGFADYRKTVQTIKGDSTIAFGRGELGVGYLFSSESNTFFPRVVLSTGLEGSSAFNDTIDSFGQLTASFEFVPTARAKFGSSQRIGFIIIPFVPYIASESYYNLIGGTSEFSAYAGSLLYFSEQLFIGLDVGVKNSEVTNAAGYARIFTSFTER